MAPSTVGECPFAKQSNSEKESTAEGASVKTGSAGCPYAQAMMQNSATAPSCPSTSTRGPVQTDENIPSSLPGVVELKECPAFSNSSCPFKDAKSPEEISQKLSQIPSSHLQGTTHSVLLQTLAFYHNKSNGQVTTAAATCPVKRLVPQDWSFDRAMEDFSLASIMSRLAEEHEDCEKDDALAGDKTMSGIGNPDHHEEEDDDHRDETHSTVTSSSIETLGSLAPPKDSPTGGTRRLSEALKTGTAAAHEAAESVHFVKNFIRGKIDRDLYGLLIAQLYHVYKRLELLLDQHAPTHFAACHFPRELERLPALQEDVDFWHSDKGSDEPPISPATQDYLDRLDKLGEENPLLLLAHAYTRYLGDLSGGKILGRVARRALNLDRDGEGLAFYQFPLVESAKKFKDKYRHCLNQLPLDDRQVQAMVQEANVAFLLNMRLFEELDVHGGVPGAAVRDLSDVYSVAAKNAEHFGESEDNVIDAPCPFAKSSTVLTSDGATTTTLRKHGTCPWPFILLHDPVAGMKHHETWLVIVGVAAAYAYSKYIVSK
ncbi:heme oxygenase [Nitzschia inconspicua]|uniref:Heme oxygenase n=1 Tax=Nitzschia inconspicua TaxID=303405 RepID=A0A9K3L4T0_9STRA|nr:heme oxygenase [Nitzschia inconspicua]